MVDFMPPFLRGSHAAARNSGVYPHNGAVRIRVQELCLEHMLEHDGDWVRVVER